MAGNSFGTKFKVTAFGESHGNALGVIVDGVPSGIKIDSNKIQNALNRRKPGVSTNGSGLVNSAVTGRKENDKAEILSGIFNGFSTGTPISIIIRNENQHSSDYNELAVKMRPGHADFTYMQKYGFRDYRGGGRSSGRETCTRVAAGEIARQVIESKLNGKFSCTAYTLRAAGIQSGKIDLSEIEKNTMRAPDSEAAALMDKKIAELRAQGNSTGGIIECQIKGIPAGLGEPVFDKLDAVLAHAMLSIGAVKGIEFGNGFDTVDLTGKENNDQIQIQDGKINFLSNNAGGILGGISNGNTIIFRLAIKPVPSIFTEQNTIEAKINPNIPVAPDSIKYENTTLKIKGRHDICLCPRIVPVVEAMANITIADFLLSL